MTQKRTQDHNHPHDSAEDMFRRFSSISDEIKEHALRQIFLGVQPTPEGEMSQSTLQRSTIFVSSTPHPTSDTDPDHTPHPDSQTRRISFAFHPADLRSGSDDHVSYIRPEQADINSPYMRTPGEGAVLIATSGPPSTLNPRQVNPWGGSRLLHNISHNVAPLHTELYRLPSGEIQLVAGWIPRASNHDVDHLLQHLEGAHVHFAWHGGFGGIAYQTPKPKEKTKIDLFAFGRHKEAVISWLRRNIDRGITSIGCSNLRLVSGQLDGTFSTLIIPRRIYGGGMGQLEGTVILENPADIVALSTPPEPADPDAPGEPILKVHIAGDTVVTLSETGRLRMCPLLPPTPPVPLWTDSPRPIRRRGECLLSIDGVVGFSEDTPGHLHIRSAAGTHIVRIAEEGPRNPLLLPPHATLHTDAFSDHPATLHMYLVTGGPSPEVVWLPTGDDLHVLYRMVDLHNHLAGDPPIHIRRGHPAAALVDAVTDVGWGDFISGRVLTAGIEPEKVLQNHPKASERDQKIVRELLTDTLTLARLVPRRARAARGMRHLVSFAHASA